VAVHGEPGADAGELGLSLSVVEVVLVASDDTLSVPDEEDEEVEVEVEVEIDVEVEVDLEVEIEGVVGVPDDELSDEEEDEEDVDEVVTEVGAGVEDPETGTKRMLSKNILGDGIKLFPKANSTWPPI